MASLATRCPREARTRARSMLASVQSTLEEIRAISGTVDHGKAQEIADKWRKRTLNKDFENRLRGKTPTPSPQNKIAHLTNDLRRMDFGPQAKLIDKVSAESGLQVKENSPDWQRLGYYLVQAQMQALEEIDRRTREGHKEMTFYLEDGAGTPESTPTVFSMLERWEKATPRNPRTRVDWRTAIKRFIELKGDMDIRDITKADIRDFKDACVIFPARLPKMDRALRAPEILEKYRNSDVERISANTANKYLSAMKSVLGMGVKDGFIDTNPAQGISVVAPRRYEESRLPFSSEDLKRIFLMSPVYRFGDRPKGGCGEAAYWLPLLAIYTGARLEELGQLRVNDVREENGISFLDINAEEGKSIKNQSSIRRIPIHPSLLKAGFLDEVRRIQRTGNLHLFPYLQHDKSKCTGSYSKWVNRYLTHTCGIEDKRKVFHSFRHTFKDACRRANIPRDVHDALTGHADSAVSSRYGLGFPIETLNDAIGRIHFQGLNFSKSNEDELF